MGQGTPSNDRSVLGIDPGTAILGYSVVTGNHNRLEMVIAGVLTTSAELPPHRRLQILYQGLSQIIATHRPTEVAVEALYFNRNVRSAIAVGQARGVALLAAAQFDLPVFEYSPLAVKHAILNYGRGTKEQVQEMVRMLLGLPTRPEPDDAADAAAIAICHHHHARAADLFGQLPDRDGNAAGSARRSRRRRSEVDE